MTSPLGLQALYNQQQQKKKYGPLLPPPPVSAAPNLTDPTTQYGPGQNLIGTQFNPTPSPDTAAARQQIMSQYGALADQPNRQALAEQSYQGLANLDAANLGRDIQGAGQRAAQFGRLGSGMVTAETGDIFGQHASELANIKAQLAAGTAGQEFQDQLNRLSAAGNVTNQLAGLDQARYGQLVGERGYQAGQSQQAYNNALAAAGLTQPNALAQDIAGQYGRAGGAGLEGAGNTLAQLFALTGKQPYQYGTDMGNSYGGGVGPRGTYTGGYLPRGNRPPGYTGPT